MGKRKRKRRAHKKRKKNAGRLMVGWSPFKAFNEFLDFLAPPAASFPAPSPKPQFKGAPVTNYGYSYTRTVHSDRRVRVVRADGSTIMEVPAWGNCDTDWYAMKRQYPVSEVKEGEKVVTEIVTVPEEAQKFVTEIFMSKKTPLTCLYDAVKEYSRSLLGVEFTEEDKTFFKDHPGVEEDGVPFPDTLRVAQELIAPYGLRVSRVQIQENYGVKGDILQWRKVLGCNPLAYADRLTTNAMFQEKFPKDDVTGYRFEYNNVALIPAIACGVVYGSNHGLTGSSGGHAVYLPPRRRVSGALLSFQIGRAENVKWKTDPIFPPYPEPFQKKLFGFDLDKWWSSPLRTVSYTSSEPKVKPETAPPSVTPPPITSITKSSCYKCNRHVHTQKHTYAYPGLCDECWDHWTHQAGCGNLSCRDSSRNTAPPPPLKLVGYHLKTRSLYVTCPQCHQHYRYKWEDEQKTTRDIIRALEKYMQAKGLRHYIVGASVTEPANKESAPRSSTPVRPEDVITPNDTIPSSD